MATPRLDGQAVIPGADPNAEPIHQRWGFSTVGLAPSQSIPGRMPPRVERGL